MGREVRGGKREGEEWGGKKGICVVGLRGMDALLAFSALEVPDDNFAL